MKKPVAEAYNRYSAGEITQTAAIVDSSAAIAAMAGCIFFTCTEKGAEIGAAICQVICPVPVAGSFAGALIGAGFGAVCAGGAVLYNWWEESERQELADLEQKLRALADAIHEQKKKEEFYRKCQEKARRQQERGWELFYSGSL